MATSTIASIHATGIAVRIRVAEIVGISAPITGDSFVAMSGAVAMATAAAMAVKLR